LNENLCSIKVKCRSSYFLNTWYKNTIRMWM
jgi:hypothetical protein